jgi:hypothetical protein
LPSFSLRVANDGEPPRLIVISLFFSQVSRWKLAERLVVISLFFLRCRRRRWTKQARHYLLHLSKKIGVKNKQIKRKVDVHLLTTDTLVLLEEHFLQHHFSNVFCNIVSTPLLQHCFDTLVQHCLLQQHFNIAFVAPSFCNIAFVLEWWRGLGFLMGEVSSWGLKCLGSRIDFFNG